uniref:Uncharacterized protein n=1 Tax=Arundo donax TaxID=35708 RepID=A0A0A9EQA3_ARUDO
MYFCFCFIQIVQNVFLFPCIVSYMIYDYSVHN